MQAGGWNPVAWAIETSSSGTTVDPSGRKECRWNGTELSVSRQWCSEADVVEENEQPNQDHPISYV